MVTKNLAKDQKNRHRLDEVVNIAHLLFMKDGYEKVGIRDICKAANLNPVQLYRLGLDKQDLLAEVILRVNAEIIKKIKPFSKAKLTSTHQFIENYLLSLYKEDIAIKAIRSEGAAFGWKWSAKYEALVIEQVFLFLKPIVDALEHEKFDEIQARCIAIWSLYYVGYRNAVMNNASAEECLENIKPSLAICLKR